MTEKTPETPEQEAPEVEEIDLETATADDLMKEIDQRAARSDQERSEEDGTPEPDDEAEVEEPEPEAEPEDAVEEPEGEAEEVAAEAADERPLEEIQSELEEAKKQAEHFHKISGREAGRAGFLEQQLKKVQEQLEEIKTARIAPMETSTGYEPEAGDVGQLAQAVSAIQRDLAAQKQYATSQAMNDAGLQFINLHDDVQEYAAEVTERLTKDHAAELKALTDAADPVAAKQRTSELLQSVYWQVKQEKLSAEIEKRGEREADQASELRKRKLAAAPASAGQGKAAPKPKLKELKTADEIGREIDRRARAAR